jgi:hypothetical protein
MVYGVKSLGAAGFSAVALKADRLAADSDQQSARRTIEAGAARILD